MKTDLAETIQQAIEIRDLNDLPFVTIWKMNGKYGFNFDDKPVGYSTVIEHGFKRTVVKKVFK